jgi:AcrR family transcriptional regulator
VAAETAVRGPGRPREEETDRRILDAAFRLMARHGYARMSVDAVAAAAGVTKPTIYRRYRGKEDLAVAALALYQQRGFPAETGETRADLIAQLRNFRRSIERPYGMAMIGTVLAEEHDTPELLARFRERIVGPRRAAIRRILEQAQQRGEFPPGVDTELAVTLLVGPYYARYLAGDPFPDDWETAIADAVLRALAPPSPG